MGNSDIPPKAGTVKEMFGELEHALDQRRGSDGNHNSMVEISFTCQADVYNLLDGGVAPPGGTDE